MKTELLFEDIINKLQEGKRVHLELSSNDFQAFIKSFHEKLNNRNIEQINKHLCILDHLNQYDHVCGELLLKIFEMQDDDLTVLALGTSHKHIIQYNHRLGNRIPMTFLKVLEQTLESENPEILEWTLRTIESLGGQSIFFKQKVLKNRPGFFKKFQNKWKSSHELVQFLENHWNREI